jgi:ubiquinone/menaquinone biosynthesis C-methylase UbiE
MSPDESAESFDQFATNYRQLLHDPIRERFAPGSDFFLSRKVLLLQRFFDSRKIDTQELHWLDVGCGRGDLMLAAGAHFRSASGCDVSGEMLRACPELPTRQQTNPTEIPFPDRTFDLATLVCVLHHVPPHHRKMLIDDVIRVVKPGGWLCIIEHNPFNPVTRLIVSRSPVDADAQLLTARQSRKLLAAAACANVRSTYFLYFPESFFRKLQFVERCLAYAPLGGQYAVFGQSPTA